MPEGDNVVYDQAIVDAMTFKWAARLNHFFLIVFKPFFIYGLIFFKTLGTHQAQQPRRKESNVLR